MPLIPAKLLFIFLPFILCIHCLDHPDSHRESRKVRVGASDHKKYLPLLRGKRVGLFTNHTGIFLPDGPADPFSSQYGIRTIDLMLDSGIQIVRTFAPEHGALGRAPDGAKIKDDIDPVLKIPVVSLYGKKKKPTPEDLEGIDIVVFDIQDVGVRAYTYISSLLLMMEACGEQQIPLLVLDRPNPNGHFIDGPVLDTTFRSFVGMMPIPFVYGMTIGELALMINGEGWAGGPGACDLTVVPCRNYTHSTYYLLPINPSPNLEGMRSVLLYPSLCLFEGTTLSVGRGTETPFQLVGHPDLDSLQFPFSFTPGSLPASPNPKHKGELCRGIDLRKNPIDSLYKVGEMDLDMLVEFYKAFPGSLEFFRQDGYFEKLAGTDQLREQLETGMTAIEIRSSWETGIKDFKLLRSNYLLYPE